MSGCLEWCETSRQMSVVWVCVRVCVCVRARGVLDDEKMNVTHNPKTDWAVGLKFTVLEELIPLFHRDEFNWNSFGP